MENYVRRCTLFAIIGLIVGLLIIIGGSIHAQNRAVPSDAAIVAVKYVDIKEQPVGINPGVHPVKLVKKDAKIPDAAQPNRANVKPVAGRYASLIDRISADDSNRFIPVDYCFFNSLEIRTPQDGDYEYGGNVFFKSYT